MRAYPSVDLMGDEGDSVKVYVTLPPNKQAVWNVERTHFFPDKGIAKATLLASLREKYGKETVAWIVVGTPTTDDSKVTLVNVPFGLRAGDATVNWKKEIAEGAHKRDLEKGKQREKPKL